jgi:hypothetical protein
MSISAGVCVTGAAEPDWASLLFHRGDDPDSLRAFGRAVREIGLEPGDTYDAGSNARAVMVSLRRGDMAGVARAEAGILALLPHCPPRGDGWVAFGIRDWGQPDGGVHTILVRPSGAGAALAFVQCGRERITWQFASLRGVLLHVAQHMWAGV